MAGIQIPTESPHDAYERGKREERCRCLALCEGWIGTWQKENPKYVSAQQWATDAVQDIAEAIERGIPYPPTDTRSVT